MSEIRGSEVESKLNLDESKIFVGEEFQTVQLDAEDDALMREGGDPQLSEVILFVDNREKRNN